MNATNDVFEFLRAMIFDMKDIDEDMVQPQTLLEELELDSLDYVEVQVGIKKRYGVDLTQELFTTGKITSIGNMIDYIVAESTATQS